MKFRDQRGFTILDTITAMALSGLVLAMAQPVTSQLLNQYRLRGAASQVAMELARARMQAVAQNTFVRMRFTGNSTYILETSRDGAAYTTCSEPVSLPSGVALLSDSAGSLTFNRQGFVQNNTSLSIANSRGRRTISMNSIGRVSES